MTVFKVLYTIFAVKRALFVFRSPCFSGIILVMREWSHRPLRRCAERDYSEVLRIRCISAETEVVTLQTVKIDNIFTRIEKKYIVSDKQFAAMELFNSQKSESLPEEGIQLELF